jgi:hypothetical protein
MHHGAPPRLPAFHQKMKPRAAPIVLSIGDTVQIGNQLFIVGASLIPQGLAPTPAPGPAPVPVPVPVPGPVVPTPVVNEFRDALRQFAISVIPGGSRFSIEGSAFGALAGTVTFAGVLKLVTPLWTDTHITVIAPPYTAGQGSQMWTVMRADGSSKGGYDSFSGPPIVQPAPVGLKRE